MHIKIENLTRVFDGKKALQDINLEIKKGEIFAILGSSGAGKSTLLRIINLLEPPSSGKIFFDGKEIGEMKKNEILALRRKMSLVPQGAPIFNTSVYENIAYGLKVRKKDKKEIKIKVKNALEMVGLRGYENRMANTLSGGEMQRVAFAMATVFEPELLLLDEPTANLDPIREKAIEEIVRKIRKMGITVIISTHKQKEAISLADRICVLHEGRLEQSGSPEEIFYKPKTKFVARFVGTENVMEGIVVDSCKEKNETMVSTENFEITVPYYPFQKGTKVSVCIRPEEIMILREDIPINPKHKNIFKGKVVNIVPRGGAMFRLFTLVGRCNLAVDIPRHVRDKMDLDVGKNVKISLKKHSCHVITDLLGFEPRS